MAWWIGPGSLRPYATCTTTWSCKFLPTPLSGTWVLMPCALKFIGIADAGEHEHLRRIDHAAREDDFAAGARDFRLTALPVFDADRACALKHDARDQRLDFDGEIFARHRRPQICRRGAAAAPVADGVLVAADAFVLRAVEVVVPGQTRRLRRRDIGVDQGILERRKASAQRAVAAAVGAGAAFPGFPACGNRAAHGRRTTSAGPAAAQRS